MTLHRGRIESTVIRSIRPLTREDLEEIKTKRTVPVVARFRDPHHRVARLVAAGLRPAETAAQSGYSLARIYVLQADPTFMQLVAEYRKEVTEGFVQSQDAYYELATTNMLTAERMLAEKLEIADEEGTSLPTRDLLAISRDAADRFGYGKRTLNTNVNIDFAAKLEAAISRSGKVIDVIPDRKTGT